MARSQMLSLFLLTVCHTSAAENCKDKTCQAIDDLSVLIQNQMSVEAHDHEAKKMGNSLDALSVKTSMNRSELQEVADQAVHNALAKQLPDWLKNMKNEVQDKVGELVPELTGSLSQSYTDVKDKAEKFSSDLSECATQLKDSPAFESKKLGPIKASIQESFTCLNKSVASLAKAVKATAQATGTSLKGILPGEAGDAVKVAEGAVVKAADAFIAAAEKAVGHASEAVNSTSTLCSQVSKALEKIEISAMSFITSVEILNPSDAKANIEEYNGKVSDFIDKLPEGPKEKMQELMATATEALDTVVENVPKTVTEYKDSVVSTLKGSVCESDQLLVESEASDLRFGLTAALCMSTFLTTILM